MMHVWHVRVSVHQPLVPVGVGVRLAGWIVRCVVVLMVFVVHMRVRMLHRLVHMLMLVTLGEMQPDAGDQGKRKVHRTGDQTFQLHDLQRVGQRDLAREIVVEAPGDARAVP